MDFLVASSHLGAKNLSSSGPEANLGLRSLCIATKVPECQ
jgi:hypothetical protein